MAYINLDRTQPVAQMIAELDAKAIELKHKALMTIGVLNSITEGGAKPEKLESTAFGVPIPATLTIVSSSVANPSIVTFNAAHNLITGKTIKIADHSGSTPDINGNRVATVVSPTTVSIPVNVTVGGTGGTAKDTIGREVYAIVNDVIKYNANLMNDSLMADLNSG